LVQATAATIKSANRTPAPMAVAETDRGISTDPVPDYSTPTAGVCPEMDS
jgi:hypothetical protein